MTITNIVANSHLEVKVSLLNIVIRHKDVIVVWFAYPQQQISNTFKISFAK